MSSSDKSYVGMDLCFFCQEPKQLLMDMRLRNSLPQKQITSLEPCDKCKEKYQEHHVILVEITGMETRQVPRSRQLYDNKEIRVPIPTGFWMCVPREYVDKIFQPQSVAEDVLKAGMAYIDPESRVKLEGMLGVSSAEMRDGEQKIFRQEAEASDNAKA